MWITPWDPKYDIAYLCFIFLRHKTRVKNDQSMYNIDLLGSKELIQTKHLELKLAFNQYHIGLGFIKK